MKVLQLCLRVPFPPQDGATIAMSNLANSLCDAGADVTMLAFNTKKHFVNLSAIDQNIKSKFNLQTVYLDASVKVVPAFLNLFKSHQSYNIIRFDVPEFHDKLKDILARNKFDIVQCEGLFLSPYAQTIRNHSSAKIILRAHNVEWLIWHRLAEACTNAVKKKYLQLLTRRLKKYENDAVNKFDCIVALTMQDKKLFEQDGCKVPIVIAPIGVNTHEYTSTLRHSHEMLSLFHLGSMDWMPNIEAVDWFLKNVWSTIKTNANTKLYLAGKNMPKRLLLLNMQNTIVEAEITDAKKYMAAKDVMIVPLLSGGGMRVKIIEGLAMGKAIVSTSIGAEGIDYTHEKNILIANTPQEFANSILKLTDKKFFQSLCNNARQLALEKYDNAQIGKNVFEYYQNIV